MYLQEKDSHGNHLQLVYQKAILEETLGVEFYYRYLEIVYFMNQRNNWPLPETVVLQIYSSITRMKFANFIDEIGMPDLIGKVCNRFDIPDDSFLNDSCNCFTGTFQDYLSLRK